MNCKINGCDRETEYDIDEYCKQHWKEYPAYPHKDRHIDTRSNHNGCVYYEMEVFDEDFNCITTEYYVLCSCGETWNLEYVKRCLKCDKDLKETRNNYNPEEGTMADFYNNGDI